MATHYTINMITPGLFDIEGGSGAERLSWAGAMAWLKAIMRPGDSYSGSIPAPRRVTITAEHGSWSDPCRSPA